MLCHKGTLNVGFADGVEHGSQTFGTQAGDVCHLRRQIQLAGLGVIELCFMDWYSTLASRSTMPLLPGRS